MVDYQGGERTRPRATEGIRLGSWQRQIFLLGLLGATAAFSFLVLLIFMHGLRPDLSAIGSYVSDYANGRYGILFRSALVVHGLGNLATACGLASVFASSRSGRYGAILFGTAALGIILGGLFSIDPTNAPRTIAGTIHSIVASVSFPIEAAALVCLSLAFSAAVGSRPLSLITAAAAAGSITALAWLLVSVKMGSVPGLAERVVFAVLLPWEILAAFFLMWNGSMASVADDT